MVSNDLLLASSYLVEAFVHFLVDWNSDYRMAAVLSSSWTIFGSKTIGSPVSTEHHLSPKLKMLFVLHYFAIMNLGLDSVQSFLIARITPMELRLITLLAPNLNSMLTYCDSLPVCAFLEHLDLLFVPQQNGLSFWVLEKQVNYPVQHHHQI